MLAELVAREESHLDVLLHRSFGDTEPLGGGLGVDEFRLGMSTRRIPLRADERLQ